MEEEDGSEVSPSKPTKETIPTLRCQVGGPISGLAELATQASLGTGKVMVTASWNTLMATGMKVSGKMKRNMDMANTHTQMEE